MFIFNPFVNPFVIGMVALSLNAYQEVMNDRKPVVKEEPAKTIPKGYYACVDCGKICERKNASQKRCPECQRVHRLELKRNARRTH